MKIFAALLKWLLALVPIALAGLLVLIFWGESLEDIEGRAGDGSSGGGDLLRRAAETIEAGLPFEANEAEINGHIRIMMDAREADGFELFSDFKGLWVRLGDGGFDLVFEREFLGLASTVAARIEVEMGNGGYRVDVSGGRFGRLPVPRGALSLIRRGLEKVGGVFAPEKDVLSRSGGLTITPRRLQLEPRPSPAG